MESSSTKSSAFACFTVGQQTLESCLYITFMFSFLYIHTFEEGGWPSLPGGIKHLPPLRLASDETRIDQGDTTYL